MEIIHQEEYSGVTICVLNIRSTSDEGRVKTGFYFTVGENYADYDSRTLKLVRLFARGPFDSVEAACVRAKAYIHETINKLDAAAAVFSFIDEEKPC